MTSAGKRSGVNCILLYLESISSDKVLIAKVFAKPGTPSSKICPSLNKPIRRESIKCFCPTITWFIPIVKFVINELCCSIRALSSRISIASAICKYFSLRLSLLIYKSTINKGYRV